MLSICSKAWRTTVASWLGATAICLLGAMLLGAMSSNAQEADYPSRPVRIVAPIAAGGGMDLVARMLVYSLDQRFDAKFFVENKPGAGGAIGAEIVAKSAPDGYTLLLADSSLTMNPFISANIPFKVETAFSPIALVSAGAMVIVANPSLPVKNFTELVKYAKENPGKLQYASPGRGTPHHFAMEYLKSVAGLDIVHVPYKGTAPGLIDVQAGRVPLMIAAIGGIKSQIEAGVLRPLAVTVAKRTALLPDVPSIAETYPGFDVKIWHGIMGPAGIPQPIVDKLGAIIREATKTPEFKSNITNAGFEPFDGSAADLKALVEAELIRWEKTAQDAGITPE